MVGALLGSLGDYTGLLQQVGLDVSSGQLAQRTEVNTDELTLGAKVGSMSSSRDRSVKMAKLCLNWCQKWDLWAYWWRQRNWHNIHTV